MERARKKHRQHGNSITTVFSTYNGTSVVVASVRDTHDGARMEKVIVIDGADSMDYRDIARMYFGYRDLDPPRFVTKPRYYVH